VSIVVSSAAIADLNRLRAFLIDKNPAAAQRAVAAITAAVQSLDLSPGRGRPTGLAGVRELIVPFGRSAYVLRYMHWPDIDEVVILRIWHGREQRDQTR
jgi:plasmid stabilization system protein ParE